MQLTTRSMTPYDGAGLLDVPQEYRTHYDRVPLGFSHSLSGLDLFEFEALRALAARYDRDYYVADGARTPGTRFYSVDYGKLSPYQAMDNIESANLRILLKRPENHDPRYRDLMHALFAQVLELRGGLHKNERVVRLDSSILVSSAATITPFHFDPEVSHFFQIEGGKMYHLFPPETLTEPELEQFYWMGIVNIGQVDLARCDPAKEFVFHLDAGKGLHQPQNSPHWVETCGTRSISYAFSLETNLSRALGRTRAFNYYMRKAGLAPAVPHRRPATDGAKAATMQALIPVRKGIGRVLRGGAH